MGRGEVKGWGEVVVEGCGIVVMRCGELERCWDVVEGCGMVVARCCELEGRGEVE